jgi:hypothetical protein
MYFLFIVLWFVSLVAVNLDVSLLDNLQDLQEEYFEQFEH